MKKLILGAAAALAVAAAAAAPNIIWGDAASAAAVPVVTSVTPGTGTAAGATTVTITGTDLNDLGVPVVHFGANAATGVACADSDSCTAVSPAGHGLVAVRVTDGVAGTSAATGSSEFLYSLATVPIKNAFSHLCLSEGAGVNGSHVTQQVCDGLADQSWTFETNGTIRSSTGKCMDVTGYGTRNGSKIQTYNCLGGSNQAWRPRAGFGGAYEIRGLGSGRALDDTGYSTVAGTQAQIWSFNDTDNQLWVL